jgi:shikimate kinase
VKNIYLVGPMGAGKSTIGRLLAAELRLPFSDTDKVIEEKSGADIPWIFDVEGEAGFRRRETLALKELGEAQNMVVATGGGIVLSDENRRCLINTGIVIYLMASVEQLLHRTSKDKNRPLLQVDDPEARIQELLDEREALYRDVADHVVETGVLSPKSVAEKIAELCTGTSH